MFKLIKLTKSYLISSKETLFLVSSLNRNKISLKTVHLLDACYLKKSFKINFKLFLLQISLQLIWIWLRTAIMSLIDGHMELLCVLFTMKTLCSKVLIHLFPMVFVFFIATHTLNCPKMTVSSNFCSFCKYLPKNWVIL